MAAVRFDHLAVVAVSDGYLEKMKGECEAADISRK